MWATSLITWLGGGFPVIIATLFTMVADIVPPADRDYWTRFGIAHHDQTPVVLPPHRSWIPYRICHHRLFPPETLKKTAPLLPPEESLPSSSDDMTASHHSFIPPGNLAAGPQGVALRLDIFLTYTSKRFGWTLAEAGYLSSVRAAFNLVHLAIIMPGTSATLLRLGVRPTWIDLSVARFSALLLGIGSLLTGLAPTIPLFVLGLAIFTTGTGYNPAARSLVTWLVDGRDSKDVGRLYAIIAMMDGGGVIMSGPIFAKAYKWGGRVGGVWRGSPFLIAAGLFAVVAILAAAVRLDRAEEMVEVQEEAEEVERLLEHDDENDL
ncbi:hypothetical protein MRB53_042229 [Persea americana]|nr:hypothetical protein MRB53_042229 [Persea americana]